MSLLQEMDSSSLEKKSNFSPRNILIENLWIFLKE
jgi:hypothetical protein